LTTLAWTELPDALELRSCFLALRGTDGSDLPFRRTPPLSSVGGDGGTDAAAECRIGIIGIIGPWSP